VAVGTHHRGDLAVPQAGQSAAYLAATASIVSTLGAGHGPWAGRRRGGGLVAASRFVRGSQRVLRTSRPTRHVPLSGPRGRRGDSVDERRALLPDPQLHRRLHESELQANDPSRPCPRRRTGPASCPPSPRTPHADVLPRPATTRPFNTANTTWSCSSTDTCRDGFCCLLTQPSFPDPSTQPPAGKFDSLQGPQIDRSMRQYVPSHRARHVACPMPTPGDEGLSAGSGVAPSLGSRRSSSHTTCGSRSWSYRGTASYTCRLQDTPGPGPPVP
jgi:hypothetical protein